MQPVKPLGYGLQGSHIYCNYDLFRRAEVLPDLHIKSWRGWRIWLEMKRVRDDIIVMEEETGISSIDGKDIEGFVLGEIYVQVQDDQVVVRNNKKEEESGESWENKYKLGEFVHNLRGVFKDIK